MSSTAQHHALPRGREIATLLALGAVQFTHILDFMIMMPMGAQLMRVFQINPEQFSLLVAAYGGSAAIAGFLGGFFMDRFDRKRALLTIYVGFGLATLACGLAPTHHWLMVARIAAGAFGGLASSLVTAMVGDVIPPERRGRATSFVMSAFPVASVLGIPMGLKLAVMFGWHGPFFFLAACSAVNLVVAAFALPHIRTAVHGHEPVRQMKELLSLPIHRKALAVGGILIMGGGLLVPFLATSMVTNMGIAEADLSLAYAVGGACTFFSMAIVGWLSDHMNRFTLLTWLSVAASIVAVVVTHMGPTPLPLVCTVMALFMVSMSGRFAPTMTMVTNAVEARYRGGFMSVNNALQQLATAMANYIAGKFVTTDAAGRLVGYPMLGYLAVIMFGVTVYLAYVLKTAAPHVAIPRPKGPATPAAPPTEAHA